MHERSISDTLFDLGVVHERDALSPTDGCHKLFYAGRCIGRYSAFEVCNLMREHGLDQETLTAAAPALYDALREMVDAHGGLGCSPAVEKAKAALALASRDAENVGD
jgi:hypothetical protein